MHCFSDVVVVFEGPVYVTEKDQKLNWTVSCSCMPFRIEKTSPINRLCM